MTIKFVAAMQIYEPTGSGWWVAGEVCMIDLDIIQGGAPYLRNDDQVKPLIATMQ